MYLFISCSFENSNRHNVFLRAPTLCRVGNSPPIENGLVRTRLVIIPIMLAPFRSIRILVIVIIFSLQFSAFDIYAFGRTDSSNSLLSAFQSFKQIFSLPFYFTTRNNFFFLELRLCFSLSLVS